MQRRGTFAFLLVWTLLVNTAWANFNDPKYDSQKSLRRIQFESGWSALRKSPLNVAVRIGMIDSGPIDSSHPELLGRISTDSDTITSDDKKPEHGQLVTGIIAANHNNDFGGVGLLGPAVQIVYKNIIEKKQRDNRRRARFTTIAAAIRELADQNLDAINLSIGIPSPCKGNSCELPIAENPIVANAILYAIDRGVPVVISAGNSGVSIPRSSLAARGLIVVGATRGDVISSGSNYGPGVTLYAPEDGVLGLTSDDTTFREAGTSLAAPFVTGTVGLLKAIARAKGKTLTVLELRNLILSQSETIRGGQFLNFGSAVALSLK